MELFPASDEDQWSLIKGVIDDCDYYVVVIGGRYGSLGPAGISYTEMEYRYAVSIEKPVIAFLHKDPTSIPAKLTEQTEDGRKRLDEFRKLAQHKMCKYWNTPQELGSVVSRSLIMLQKKHPGIGWIRGDQVTSIDATVEMLKLRKKIEQLEAELEESQIVAPKGAEHLAQGEDKFELSCTFESTGPDHETYNWEWAATATWNQLFSEISPLMIHETNTAQLRSRLSTFVENICKAQVVKDKKYKGHRLLRKVVMNQSSFETVIIQLSALGLISQSVKNRSVKDGGTYWTLTPYGVTVMNRLRAVLKENG
jgi:predicted transcriptional regulator